MVGDVCAVGGHADASNGEAREAWPMWKLVLIALPQLGVSVLWCFIGPNSAPYMLHLGMGPSLATLNNIAGPISGFFTGPIVGATSDNLSSRFGRRRPVILAGLVLTWIAGMLFAGAEHFLPRGRALFFAAPMYWVMDVTINILQTPHRALVADLASPAQQLPMQVVFVVVGALGNFLAYCLMQIYAVPADHMLELMLGICVLNTLCIAVQFLVAKEKQLRRHPDAPRQSLCAPVMDVVKAVRGSPRLLYHLAFVQCLVWIGNTAWNVYGLQWFADAVYAGDQGAPEGSPKKIAYGEGVAAFSHAGMARSALQVVSALAIIFLLLKTSVRPRVVYAPCIYIGALMSILAAFAVGHNGAFAMVCMTLSVLPETGSFAIPFGLVATLNKRAEEQGKHVSTALQMALLNCCVTVGQQICTTVLSAIESRMPLEQALPCVFMLAAAAKALAGSATLCLDDRPCPCEPKKKELEGDNSVDNSLEAGEPSMAAKATE